ncbi:MAG: YkgJ family cysteine cluster protein [Proteobacteria bacterium]|nr:YkgJ family cysteine cluster protein [Pseudomonadota bacterium]
MTDTCDAQPFRPLDGPTFRFLCHGGIDCFTQCCADLHLVLTPYDILRTKNRLGISSDDFLNQYTDTRFDQHARFPMVRLQMNGDERRECPFVTPHGCSIYEDRPGACRMYPLGRATLKLDSEDTAREKFFVVAEGHCLGFQEQTLWTVKRWMEDQGVREYNAMNDHWLEIIGSTKGLGPEKAIQQKLQMFYMASYNPDKFRRMLYESSFFDLFAVDPEQRERMASDDIALMHFSFDWLKFSLFGESTVTLKSDRPLSR